MGGSPRRGWVWFHRASAAGWALLTAPAYLWWSQSVLFVIVASIYANVKSDWGAAEAADDQAVMGCLERIEQRLTRIERHLEQQTPPRVD